MVPGRLLPPVQRPPVHDQPYRRKTRRKVQVVQPRSPSRAGPKTTHRMSAGRGRSSRGKTRGPSRGFFSNVATGGYTAPGFALPASIASLVEGCHPRLPKTPPALTSAPRFTASQSQGAAIQHASLGHHRRHTAGKIITNRLNANKPAVRQSVDQPTLCCPVPQQPHPTSQPAAMANACIATNMPSMPLEIHTKPLRHVLPPTPASSHAPNVSSTPGTTATTIFPRGGTAIGHS